MEEKNSEVDLIVPDTITPLYTTPKYNVVIEVDFFEGYTFRQLFEFYRQTLTCAPMYFSEDGIRIFRGNSGGDGPTAVSMTSIRGEDLVSYKVDMDRVNHPEEGYHIINVNLTEFYGHIKAIARKEGFRMFQYAEYPDIIVCQFYGGNKHSNGYIVIRTETFKDIEYNIDDDVDEDTEPNVRVPLPMFCGACSNIARLKYSHAILKVYPKGAHLLGATETGSSTRNVHWGEVNSSRGRLRIKGKEPRAYETKIPLNIIKAMTKMANFNSGSVVKIYGSSDGLARLELPVGCYAEHIQWLVEPKVEDDTE